MAYNLQLGLRMYVVGSLLSNYRLVPECHIHPEDQIRSYVYSPFHKECPACIQQPHVRQAIHRPSDWPGQREITM